jgi:hypothetical protein
MVILLRMTSSFEKQRYTWISHQTLLAFYPVSANWFTLVICEGEVENFNEKVNKDVEKLQPPDIPCMSSFAECRKYFDINLIAGLELCEHSPCYSGHNVGSGGGGISLDAVHWKTPTVVLSRSSWQTLKAATLFRIVLKHLCNPIPSFKRGKSILWMCLAKTITFQATYT